MNRTLLTLLSSGIISCSVLLSGCVPAIIAGGAGAVAGASSVSSGLSLSTQMDDVSIKSHAYDILNHMESIKFKSNVDVVVFNREVLLVGHVPTQQSKHEIATKIAHIHNVRTVYDHLVVGESDSIGNYSHDSWISTKVKSNFVGEVNPLQYEVITENGVVYLLAVTTKEDGKKAAEVASKVSGVKKVVTIFTYVKPEKTSDNTQSKNTQPTSGQPDHYKESDLTHAK